MIRQVRPEDWERLRDVRLRALASDPEAFLETPESATARPNEVWQARAMADATHASFVVEQDERFEGMVGCFIADDPWVVFVVAMWVAPELRGSGVAGGLVDRVVEWARARDARLVCLSVEAGNLRAARLYESRGFVETADPPSFPYEPPSGERFYVFDLARSGTPGQGAPK